MSYWRLPALSLAAGEPRRLDFYTETKVAGRNVRVRTAFVFIAALSLCMASLILTMVLLSYWAIVLNAWVQINIGWPAAYLLLAKSISLRNLASLALDRALKLRIAWIWKLNFCLVRREITGSMSMYDRPVSENHSCWLRIPDIVSITTSRDSEEWIVCRAKSWSNGKLGSCCTVRRRF